MTQYDFHDVASFLSLANDPERVAHADETDVYVKDPDSGMLEHNDDHKAVYSTESHDIFGVVTDEYQIINPPEFLGPLARELSDRDRAIEGTYRMFNGGAVGYVQVLLSDSGIWPADRTEKQEPIKSGVTCRWSHDGGVSVRAEGFAQDGMCANTMRRVSDSVYVKHAGDTDERVDFREEWSAVLDSLGAFSEALEATITDAWEYELWDLSDHAFSADWLTETSRLEKLDDEDPPAFMSENQRDGIAGFYDLLGFPRYIGYAATVRLMGRLTQKDDVTSVSAWDAYSALTYALTHQARFDQGSSTDDDYHRAASDLLHNPPLAEESAGRALQSRLRPDEETDMIEADAGDAMRAFKEREKELRQAFGDD